MQFMRVGQALTVVVETIGHYLAVDARRGSVRNSKGRRQNASEEISRTNRHMVIRGAAVVDEVPQDIIQVIIVNEVDRIRIEQRAAVAVGDIDHIGRVSVAIKFNVQIADIVSM